MQTKERVPRVRKVLVRNVEKKNPKAAAKREFVVDPVLWLNSAEVTLHDTKEANLFVPEIRSRTNKDISKVLDAPEEISTSVKALVNQKASKKLNFPFDEVIYQDLISLNNEKQGNPDEVPKHLNKPRRQRKLDPEPKLDTYLNHKKKELLFLDHQIKRKEIEGHRKNFQIERYSEGDETAACNYDFSAERNCSPYSAACSGRMGESSWDLNDMEKLKKLHVNLGLACPKLKSHFDGFSLHRKSQAWKV